MRFRHQLLAILLVLTLGRCVVVARAQESAPVESPGMVAQALRGELFSAQAALLAGDHEKANAAVASARAEADRLLPSLVADRDSAVLLERAIGALEEAVIVEDATALGVASGEVWSALVRGAFSETMAALADADADTAAAWLLVRDFRPTTRFDRPNGDATLAVKGLREGHVLPEQAAATARADLLDTYQARLETALDALAGADPQSLSLSEAEAVGLAGGYWPILASAYAEQFGADAANDAADTFFSLAIAAADADRAAFATAQQNATDIVRSFRAAPLSGSDRARRAGQLVRYLSLIPVEYGRGVKNGHVLLDLEIQEAQAFLAGARASFADLRLPLRALSESETAAIDRTLVRLEQSLANASTHTAVADPSSIASLADEATKRFSAIAPPEWLAQSADSDFDVVSSLLDQVLAAVAAGQYQQAESARIEAYAIFETGPEKRLLAFTPDAALRVERLFWEGDGDLRGLRALIDNRASITEVRATQAQLDSALTEAQAALAAGTAPAAVVFNAATIVFREGLEAVLILASLLAGMIGANRQYKRPLAVGALSALLVTAVLFVLAQSALLSFGRYSEQLEAIVSVIAIGVLLLVMNWFFHKVYWTRWIAKHHEHRRRLLIGGYAGQALGFVVLGFTSVFREGAETVLFLQALVLDAGTWIVVQGTLLGLAATAVVGALTLVLHAKLPHKKMLIVTGIMISAVLVTMVGSTVHTLQLVGWLPISPIPGSERLPYWLGVWFGVHGTWQGVVAQLATIGVVLGSYVLAESQNVRARRSIRASGVSVNAGDAVPTGHV